MKLAVFLLHHSSAKQLPFSAIFQQFPITLHTSVMQFCSPCFFFTLPRSFSQFQETGLLAAPKSNRAKVNGEATDRNNALVPSQRCCQCPKQVRESDMPRHVRTHLRTELKAFGAYVCRVTTVVPVNNYVIIRRTASRKRVKMGI